jgi:hypothetical protein
MPGEIIMTKYTDAILERLATTDVRHLHHLPSHVGHMTWKKLTAMIRAGFGQGHLEFYRPWRQVTKRDYSPSSNLSHLHAPEYGHVHHPRSIAQRNLLNLEAWCGAFDVRDQYPVWPWPHDHPIDGLFGVSVQRLLRGSHEIGRECGILPSCYPGTRIPRVLTFHSLATLADAKWRVRMVALQVDATEGEELVDVPRARELNILRRRYCIEAGIDFKTVTVAEVGGNLPSNLDAIRPQLSRDAVATFRRMAFYERLVGELQANAYEHSPAWVLERFARKCIVTREMLQTGLHIALWFQDLDHDLSKAHEMWNPLQRGGIQLRQAMRERLFGGHQS